MTNQITWLLADDGGFIVRSKNGNFSYAYPTSPNAYRAKLNVAGADRERVARQMAMHANAEADWVPLDIVNAHNKHLAETFDAARERSGTLLGVI